MTRLVLAYPESNLLLPKQFKEMIQYTLKEYLIGKNLFILIVFLCFSLFTEQAILAQTNISGFGLSIVPSLGSQHFLNLGYEYQSRLMQIQINSLLGTHKTKGNNVFQLQWLLQLQTGYSIYRYDSKNPIEKGMEAGMNGGFILSWHDRHNRLTPYMALHAGPHYISGSIKRQKAGFIFSDNFALGLLLHLKNKLYLDIRPAFRHLSNAGFGLPNGGINTLQWGIGIYYDF